MGQIQTIEAVGSLQYRSEDLIGRMFYLRRRANKIAIMGKMTPPGLVVLMALPLP